MSPPSQRLLDRLQAMAHGSARTNAAIQADLAAMVIDDDESQERAAELVAELATRQPWVVPQLKLGPSAWRDHVLTTATTGPMGGSWLRDFDVVMEIVFDLYERDFGSTRETLHFLNQADPRIPYLRLFILHALFATGASPDVTRRRRTLEKAIRSLLGEDAPLRRWAEAQRQSGVLLKALSGMTHTILGMYDWIAKVPASGFSRLPVDAEARFDLGGGFGTPDVARLLGCSLTSLDLQKPSDAQAMGVRRFQVAIPSRRPELVPAKTRWQSDEEAARYLRDLQEQPHRHWDVFTDALDESAVSYLLTSFGFLTSTVASHSPHALGRGVLGRNVLSQMHTTLVGLGRVMRLAALGKDVALLTYQRATSRAYRNATVFLRFADHRLAASGLVELPFQRQGAGILAPPRSANRQ